MKGGALLLAALILPAPARAWWLREDGISGQAGHNYGGIRLFETGIYEEHTGLGVGVAPFELQHFGWDVPRGRQPDASGHQVSTLWALKGYATLHSWKSTTWFDELNTVGRLELFGSYSNWARLGQFNQVIGYDQSGTATRGDVEGSVPARVIDVGLHWDYGYHLSLIGGRYELKTRPSGVFLSHYSMRWYAAAQLMFGGTFPMSETAGGGGLTYMISSAWTWLRAKTACTGPDCGFKDDPDNPK